MDESLVECPEGPPILTEPLGQLGHEWGREDPMMSKITRGGGAPRFG
jgi:hypothetical protein